MNWENDPTKISWKSMIRRCHGSHDKSAYYRGRGIQVCERWRDFFRFLEDMGHRPEGTTLDRIDVNGHYCPENCRWATRIEQMRNKRSNHVIEYGGESMCLEAWGERLGVWPETIRTRMKKGWPMDQVMRDSSVRHHVNQRKKSK